MSGELPDVGNLCYRDWNPPPPLPATHHEVTGSPELCFTLACSLFSILGFRKLSGRWDQSFKVFSDVYITKTKIALFVANKNLSVLDYFSQS